MLEFKKIELSDLDLYKKFTASNKEFSCENSFVNLLVWQCTYNNMMAICDGQVIIKSGNKDREVFKLPMGDDFEKGLKLIYEYCSDKSPSFWAQEGERFSKFIEVESKNYNLKESRDACDYIYLRDNLAFLKGKKYHSKRNHINAFSKKHNWKYEKITADNIEKVRECAALWYAENIDRLDKYMLCEKNGIDIILNNFEALEIKGGMILINEKAVAFTLGSAINDEVFDIHIEKALKDYGEAYTVINNQFALNELENYKYINREDDLGLEGLRKAKLSYHPHILLKKYSCTPVK
ncbi:MAG: DUF2156 domain-containing protein [Clostridia bacterium]|nr:DUF2156 domain-containing protein [Clostridia bacterium]